MHRDRGFTGAVYNFFDKTERPNGCIRTRKLVLVHERRVRACCLSNDDIVQVHVGLERATGAHAHETFAAELVDQLVGVQGDGRDTHTRPHDGHGRALVGAGEAQHVTHRVELLDVLQVVLGDELRAQRITRQEDRLGDRGGGVDVRCRTHVSFPSSNHGAISSSASLPCGEIIAAISNMSIIILTSVQRLSRHHLLPS